jgi:phage tail protein X
MVDNAALRARRLRFGCRPWLIAAALPEEREVTVGWRYESGMMLGGASGACKLVRASRFLIALGVILVGICAAWPFRQPRAQVPVPPSAPVPLVLTLRRPDAPLELAPRLEASPAVGFPAAPLTTAGSPPLTPAATASLDNLVPPPALPVSFQPSATGLVAGDWQPAPVAKAMSSPSRPRPYRLRDGDTLEKIAERYLGERERASEIFEANRDVLSRPDLLPVGVTILLPPRRAAGELAPVAAER